MRKALFFLLLAFPVWGSGPKYNYRDPRLNDEMQNIYKDIPNVLKGNVRISSVTISSLTVITCAGCASPGGTFINNQNTLQSGATAYPDFIYAGSSVSFPTGKITNLTSTNPTLSGGSHTSITPGQFNFSASTLSVNTDGSVTLGVTSVTSPSNGTFWYDRVLSAFQFQSNGTQIELDPLYIVYQNVSLGFTTGLASQFCAVGNMTFSGTSAACNGTEALVPGIAGVSGTVSKMSITVGRAGCTNVITMRKNGANTSMACTLAAGLANSSHCENNTSFSVVAGDQLDFSFDGGTCTPAAGGLAVMTLVLKPGVQ